MEWVDGKDLDEVEITPERVLSIKQAMDKIHAQEIVHNDLKPEHIKIQDDGQIRIVDFDLATNLNDTRHQIAGAHKITSPNPQHPASFNGTIRYAPIDAHLGRWTKPFCDIESLYYVTRHLLKADLPWSPSEDVQDLNEQIRNTGFEKIRDVYGKNPALWQLFEEQKNTGNGEVRHDLFEQLFAPLFSSSPRFSSPLLVSDVTVASKLIVSISDKPRAAESDGKSKEPSVSHSQNAKVSGSMETCTAVSRKSSSQKASRKSASVKSIEKMSLASVTSGHIGNYRGHSAEDIVKDVFRTVNVELSDRPEADCVTVRPEDFAFPFRAEKCETDVYSIVPDFHIKLSQVAQEADHIHVRMLAKLNRLAVHDVTKVIGKIGMASCKPLTRESNDVLKRNQNSAALAREVENRHPLMIAKLVQESVVFLCSGNTEQLEDSLDQFVIPRFLSELLMFPVDHVLVALGRYHVVGIGGRGMAIVESVANALHVIADPEGAVQRERTLLERERTLLEREKAVDGREKAVDGREKAAEARQKELDERARQLDAARQKALDERARQLDALANTLDERAKREGKLENEVEDAQPQKIKKGQNKNTKKG